MICIAAVRPGARIATPAPSLSGSNRNTVSAVALLSMSAKKTVCAPGAGLHEKARHSGSINALTATDIKKDKGMYIINPMGTAIYNSEFFERILIVDKPDASLIIGSYTSEREPVTMARYKRDEARNVLCEIFDAIDNGKTTYALPDSTLFYEENHKYDGRTRRKGGS